MALGEAGQDGEKALLHGGRVQGGQKDDQGAARGRTERGRREAAGVRLDEFRFQRGHGVDQGREDVARRAALDEGAYPAVVGEEVHAVAGAGGQGGEEQGRVHGGVQARRVADAAGGGAAGVQDEEDVAVAFGTPGAYRDRRLAGGGAPVDRAGVVAGNVLAEAVELRALAAGQDAGAAVEFAQAGQLGRAGACGW